MSSFQRRFRIHDSFRVGQFPDDLRHCRESISKGGREGLIDDPTALGMEAGWSGRNPTEVRE